MSFAVKILVVAVSWTCMMSLVLGGGGGGGHKTYIKASYPHHTHHEYHVEKIPEVKIIEVPVVKEVKVLQPYKVPYKLKVPYVIKQEIHTVQEHKHPVHTSEHIHHKPTEHSHHFSHAASAQAPQYVSHSPVGPSSHDMTAQFMSAQHSTPIHRVSEPTEIFGLNTKVESGKVGFGSQEGKSMDDVYGWNAFNAFKSQQRSGKAQDLQKSGSSSAPQVFPYPFPQEQIDILSGKSQIEYGYDFNPSHFDYVSSSYHH